MSSLTALDESAHQQPHDAAAVESPSLSSPTSPSASSSFPSSSSTSTWHTRLLTKLDPRNWHSTIGWPLLLTYFLVTYSQELPTTANSLLIAKLYSPADSNQVYASLFLPWTCRPVYAFIADQVPIASSRRRSYFIIACIGGCITQVCLALFGHTSKSYIVLAVTVQIFLAMAEVACDALTVEWGNELAQRLTRYQAEKQQQQPVVRTTRSGSMHDGIETPLLAELPLVPHSSLIKPALIHVAPVNSSTSESPLSSFAYDGAYQHAAGAETVPMHRLNATSGVRISPSLTSSSSISTPPPHPSSSTTDKIELMIQRVFTHILATTAPKDLSPGVIKSRIQSECMSIRTAGSVFASAQSIVMLLYMSTRMVLFTSSFVFLFGIGAILFYVQERPARFLDGIRIDEKNKIAAMKASDGTHHYQATPTSDERKGTTGNTATTHPQHIDHASDSTRLLSSVHDSSDSSAQDTDLAPNQLEKQPSSFTAAPTDYLQHQLTVLSVTPVFIIVWDKLLKLLRAMLLLTGPLVFIFFYNLMPSSEDTYYNYLYNSYYQFMNWQFGLFNFIGLSGSMCGCLFYQVVLATPSGKHLNWIFVCTTLLASIVGCSQIFLATQSNSRVGIGDQWMIILTSFFVSAVGSLATIPPIILASHYAVGEYKLEASMFSLFAAAAHLGSLGSAEISAGLTLRLGITEDNYTNLWKLIVICNGLALLPLLILPFLPYAREMIEKCSGAKEVDSVVDCAESDTTTKLAQTPISSQ